MSIESVRRSYRELRRRVYEEATLPDSRDPAQHARNKQRFRAKVSEICDAADLARYRAGTPAARTALWHHLWSKNRYAGIRAQLATDEINDLTPQFDDYAWFIQAGWNIEAKGHEVVRGRTGALAMDFLNRSGVFANRRTVGNVPKLRKIVAVARAYKQYFDDHTAAPATRFVTDGNAESDVWPIHARLLALGYKGDLTALHFMADTGFQVIKPDLVVSRLFLDWGWLHRAMNGLPADVERQDLLGKGRYGTRYLYTKPTVYKPIIDFARAIVSGTPPRDLASDIGWCTNNPMREFDLFVVKAGQLPERDFGIERRLYP